MRSASKPAIVRRCASSLVDRPVSTISLSHLTGTFMSLMSSVPTRLDERGGELTQEAEVVPRERAQVADAILHHDDPLDAETECKPRVPVRVVSDAAQDIGMHHPRPTKF